MTESLTARLADLVVGLSIADVPPAGRQLVEWAFADTVGCVLAGADSDEARLAAGWSASLGGRGDCTVLGRSERLPVPLAALVNATAGHALDLDDVSPTMTHPSTCLVPPLLALAERQGSSGADLTIAYVAGFEVCTRLCRILNPAHYYRGWHSMSTVNGLGVAAAAGRLLGLDAAGVRMAMAIAAASSSGIRKNFGTMVKPLHAGQAAFHGVQAAELAAAGFVADDAVLDGEHGYLHVFGDDSTPAVLNDPDRLELTQSGLIFKRYACCGALHPAIDVVRELMAEHGLDATRLRGIECSVNSRALHVLVHHRATTPAEGRFSVEYSLAVAAIDGDAGPVQFTPERVADGVVQDLSARVSVSVDEQLPTGYALFPAVVTLVTDDGSRYTARRDIARGTPEEPMDADEIYAKFRSCAAVALGDGGVDAAEQAMRRLPTAERVGELLGALRP